VPTPIYINGKFYGAGLNGVHRVADRLIHELDRIVGGLPEAQRPCITLFVPRRRCWPLNLQAIKVVEQSYRSGQLWEQFVLPNLARDGLLVNLCNIAPVAHLNKVTMIHDAQYLMSDNSYPRPTRWLHKTLSPLIARSSRLVITISEYSRHMLDLMRIADRSRVRIIPNGVDHLVDAPPDTGLLEQHGLVKAPFVVHVASAKAYKNTQIVLEAFRSPRLEPLTLVLAGASREELAAAGLQPPSRSICVGKINDAQLAACYRAAVCMVFPSRAEGFGLPPAEAMILGCPAVVAPSGAIPEVCGDAVLYASVDDPDAWIGAVLQLHNDAALRTAKIRAGLERMSSRSWAVAGEALMMEIMRLAQTKKAGGRSASIARWPTAGEGRKAVSLAATLASHAAESPIRHGVGSSE
jgi:glycosyltransferase involved in cell wall biosynthesis